MQTERPRSLSILAIPSLAAALAPTLAASLAGAMLVSCASGSTSPPSGHALAASTAGARVAAPAAAGAGSKPTVLASAETTSANQGTAATAPASNKSRLGRAIAQVEGDPRGAREALDALRGEFAFLSDVLDYHAARARLGLDAADGRRALEAFLAAHADSVLVPDAAADLASALEAAGDRNALLALAERRGRGADASSQAAAVCLAAGRLLSKDAPAQAASWLACARHKAPLSTPARAAAELVTALRRDHPSLRPSTAATLMDEARLLAREGRPGDQAATLQELLRRFPGSAHEGEAELALGRALGRSEGKSAGADFFVKRAASASSSARKAKLLYEAGNLRWNDDRNEEARATFEKMLALKSGIGDEQQAMYAVARIHDSAGRRREAVEWYGRAAAAARGATRAESLWRQGWVPYRAGEFDEAEKRFAAMAAAAAAGSDTDGRAEALYWQARAREKSGRKAEAAPLYEKVIAEFPVGYYAAAAERRLGRRTPVGVRPPDPVAPSDLPGPASLAIRRAVALREAGLVSLAARDLSARLDRFDAATRRAVLPALPKAGAWDAAFRIASQMHDRRELSREQTRAYLYPRAHGDIVEREARAAGIDPTLVWAIMRQESAFASAAVSPAKALGLLQLLESTARRVATANGLPVPTPDDLFEPAVNIRLGVRYLAELSRLFDGNTVLMAAAYNAGETAAQRWQKLASSWEEDELIEQISYRETRHYVKAVLRNMRNYRRIYGSAAAAPTPGRAGTAPPRDRRRVPS